MHVAPRQTQLHRVPDLAGFRTAIADLVQSAAPGLEADTFVIVPSRAAAEQLRRTLEERLLSAARPVLFLPSIGTRSDWYRAMALRLSPAPRQLTMYERDVLLAASARATERSGLRAPFNLRPALVADMLELYDHVRRLRRTVADFERNLQAELRPSADTDRGAAKLLQQTEFLGAAFREFESRTAAGLAVDEHGLRARLLEDAGPRPLVHVIVTVPDRSAEQDGLWPADFDLLTRARGLQRLDLVCTEGMLGAGLLERLQAELPGLAEAAASASAAPPPVLDVPRIDVPAGVARLAFESRDRVEELAVVARRLKAARRAGDLTPLQRVALVVRRPLPYLYVAREVFGSAGIPFESLDTLPLAAEPYAAALDLVLDTCTQDFTRTSLLALLRSPHFTFRFDGEELPPAAVAALDGALADARYDGGAVRLAELDVHWRSPEEPLRREGRRRQRARPALTVARDLVGRLALLQDAAPATAQLTVLLDFLQAFDRPRADESNEASRRARVRAAVWGTLAALRAAYARHDPEATFDAGALATALKRWLGVRTFAAYRGTSGVQLLGPEAARYGLFDDVQILGLVSGEWPEPARRTVLYPASLMQLIEPERPLPDSPSLGRDLQQGAAASFRDLLRLAARRVRVSTFALEDEAIVEPSTLIDELAASGLPQAVSPGPASARIFLHEALTADPPLPEALASRPEAWARVRLQPRDEAKRFRGEAGPWTMPRVSVSRLERYLDCPFRFFASEVLRLEEEPQDEDTRTPLERGRFLHELFERFFAEWQRRGHRQINPETLADARALLEQLCESALASLPPAEAALERARLLGSAVGAGIAHRVLSVEAERAVPVRERLLEFPLEGDFTFATRDGRSRTVTLKAIADRIDLLADGSMRVIDYKSKTTPDVRDALQLPIYSLCAQEQLRSRSGQDWRLGEAAYLSFEGERAVIPLRAKGKSLDELVGEAQERLIDTLDGVAAGRFSPSPARRSLCTTCPYASVCRREWVEVDDE